MLARFCEHLGGLLFRYALDGLEQLLRSSTLSVTRITNVRREEDLRVCHTLDGIVTRLYK